MYGNCDVCGKRYGEINGQTFPPCEHVTKAISLKVSLFGVCSFPKCTNLRTQGWGLCNEHMIKSLNEDCKSVTINCRNKC